MPRILTLTLALLALAPCVASAQTPLYASPTGDDSGACTEANPCDMHMAIGFAQEQPADFEVVLLPGDYMLVNQLVLDQPFTLRGVAGTLPRMVLSGAPFVDASNGVTLRDVEIVQGDTGRALLAQDAKLERVVVRATGEEGLAADLRGGTVMQSSAVLANAPSARAIEISQSPGGVKLQHVTAEAGESALMVKSTESDAHAIVESSILRGSEYDVELAPGTGTATAAIRRSAFNSVGPLGTVEDLGGNIATEPKLTIDRIHQAADSPTIDAGAAISGGPATDLDGSARSQGAAPDMGADEAPAPPPKEEPAPTASPAPENPNPPAIVPVDLSLPGFLTARFPTPPVAGRPSDLVIEAYDPDAALLGVVVDLGPAGLIGLSACTTLKPTGPFVPGRPVRFTVPVIFPAPGLQPYTLEIRSGGCGGSSQQVSRSDLTAQVGTGALTARAAQATRCASTLAPRAGREAAVAAAVICLMNRERAKKRLRPLTLNARLAKSAAAHTADMLAKRYYNHQRPGGPTLKARTRKAKYRGNSGENLGLASGSLARPGPMMGMWMKSPMHRANVLNRRFRAVGVSVQAKDPLGKMSGAAIYTVNFGTRK